MPTGLKVCVPTSIVVSGAGSSGSIRSDGGVTFSTATSVSLNGVFSATYDNYMFSIRHTSTGSGLQIYYRMRVSGSDATGSNYTSQFIRASGALIDAGRNSSDSFGWCGLTTSTLRSGDTVYFYGPYLAQPTASRSVNINGQSNAHLYDIAATHSLSTSYDGITLSVGANDFSGLVTVYGYTQ